MGKKTFLLTIFFLGWSLWALTQHSDLYFLQLKKQFRTLPENGLDAIGAGNYGRHEVVQDKYYRYLQFYNYPEPSSFARFNDLGVELLGYLPKNTFLVSIPLGMDSRRLDGIGVRSSSPIPVEDKCEEETLWETFQDEHFSPLVLQCFENVDKDYINRYFQSKSIEVIGVFDPLSLFAIYCPRETFAEVIALPWVQYLDVLPDGRQVENEASGQQIRANLLAHVPSLGGHALDGRGVSVAIGDDGHIGNHIDFKNRLSHNEDVSSDIPGLHASLVAGLLGGAGNVNPDRQGVARGVQIHVYNGFDAVINAPELVNESGVVATCTALADGCNRGYTTLASLADRQIWENPELIHIFSAGNAGQEDCGYGAGNNWGNITGGIKLAKNVLAVASISEEDEGVITSSRGPAFDGRIKPDISALGEGLESTSPGNTYESFSGTSAAAPAIAGLWAQLVQAYRYLHGGENPPSALIKAALLNTAEDVGNPGPDFTFGWGRANGYRAWKVMESENYFSGSIDHKEGQTYELEVPPGLDEVRVMVYWHDREGNPANRQALVNDLEMDVLLPGGNTLLPWVLDHQPDANLLNTPAQRGIDSVNNVEQVTIKNPVSGLYQIHVEGKTVPFGPQPYFLVYDFTPKEIKIMYPGGGEKIEAGSDVRIHWDGPAFEGKYSLSLSKDKGVSWEPLVEVPGFKKSFLWEVPENLFGKVSLKIEGNGLIAQNTIPFTTGKTPEGLHLAYACPQEIKLVWDSVPSADSYVLYQLGDYYMDSIAAVYTNSIILPNENPDRERWFAVASILPDGASSPRSIAVNHAGGLVNCPLNKDLGVVSLGTPTNSSRFSCNTQPLAISANIRNYGGDLLSGFSVNSQIDGGMPFIKNFSGSIPPGVTVNVVFDTLILFEEEGIHNLKVWVDLEGDEARFNDTLIFELELLPGQLKPMPYFENFDGFSDCPVEAACGDPCLLSSGWVNDQNGAADQIDWRVYQGSTPTVGTGPENDQNTRSTAGKFLYLEGSQGCFDKAAFLLSPCIDLGGAEQPRLSFWYHLFGADMGRLHVDLFDGESWIPNIITSISGDQGDHWHKAEVDLSSFSGRIVNIRFRGVTGEGFLTDMALDNFAVYDVAAAPLAAFISEVLTTCPGESIAFRDNSFNDPLTWEWTVDPSTIEFVEGTSVGSSDPEIAFSEPGTYLVSMAVSNSFGSGQEKASQLIYVSEGKTLPFSENFEQEDWYKKGWKIENADKGIGWESTEATGEDGLPTTAVYINNHAYFEDGATDVLFSPIIDLTEADSPWFYFERSYTYFNDQYTDRLQIRVSTDCGESFEEIIFDKSGKELATVLPRPMNWQPTSPQHWMLEKIDLSAYAGQSVILKFVNTTGFGNNLFLDNVLINERSVLPEAEIISDGADLCAGEEAWFETTSEGETIHWYFGEAAIPPSAMGNGPHLVTYEEKGSQRVILKVSNAEGYDKQLVDVEVLEPPTASFTYHIDQLEVSFHNESTGASTIIWDFGDGDSSSLEHPKHQFESGGDFPVELTVINDCGVDVFEWTVALTTSTKELIQNNLFEIFPNPANEFVFIGPSGFWSQPYVVDLFDATGKKVYSLDMSNFSAAGNPIRVDHLSSGIYFIRIKTARHIFMEKLMVIK